MILEENRILILDENLPNRVILKSFRITLIIPGGKLKIRTLTGNSIKITPAAQEGLLLKEETAGTGNSTGFLIV